MGKAIGFLSFLIFLDLFFIITGQVCADGTCSLGSIIINALLNIGQIPVGELFAEFLGDALGVIAGSTSTTGILSLLATGGVIITAFVATKEFRLLLIPITLTLSVMAFDFVVIISYLLQQNFILGTLLGGPIIILYIFTIVEWLIGKD